ncbi:MAG: ABC transporter ATP-binding protein, partial [Pseudobutyrivibrio sp.]|nr:ABC transporter ATP-binding protein [Pseudobutyrivibrio sp.]
VAEDIAFALENDCVPVKEMYETVDRAAGMVDIETLLDKNPTELSGGQKQRVSMAGVIVCNVDILLFDEPLANLDPATGKRTIDLIDRLSKEQKTTVVIIEHRLEDALYRDVDRIIVVGEGRIVADMTTDELLSADILEKEGIREPLYITALKYACCNVTPEAHPAHISHMALDDYRDKVVEWFKRVEKKLTPNSNSEILRVENLCFSYDKSNTTLKDVSFSVKKGEMLAIAGKNGAGKSTLAGLICGFFKPDSGRIIFNGADMAPLSIKERGEHIGLVMQNPNQMISKPLLFDEVALGLSVRGVPKDEITERVNAVLETCGLYRMRNWPISALSFGQKKRATIASILVMNPEILILDEPTAGQDFRHYTKMMEFIERINRELGITIILITHDMHLMLEYTDRTLVLADGKLLADSTPAKVLTDDTVSYAAYLKKTSLYDLAVGCGLEASAFVDSFIAHERAHRSERSPESE